MLYIGDLNGKVSVFNTDTQVIDKEIQLFPEKYVHDGMSRETKTRKTRALYQLVVLKDKELGTFIVGTRNQKRKIALFSIKE